MKIGFDAKRLYNNGTGLGNHSRTTIDILTEYFPENAYFLFTPKIKEKYAGSYPTKEGCKTILPSGLLKGGLWRTLSLGKEAEKEGVELFHGLSNELPLGLKMPSVVTIHDVAFRTFPKMYHWLDRWIYDLKWRYACKHADRIIAISECTKHDVMRFYGVDERKIDVVYQPVAPRFYTLMDESEAASRLALADFIPASDFMLYVGAVNSRKNLLGVVKAIELLPKELQLPLVVVGGGKDYKKKVKQYIAAHGLEDLIIFPKKRVDDDTLQALYRKAKLFVYPSFYEGFGLPVVEALLSECPVVTSNVSSLPEAGGPYSLQANPADTSDIAAKIKQVLTDDALRDSMRKQGRQWAMDNLHPKVLAGKLMAVYDSTRLSQR